MKERKKNQLLLNKLQIQKFFIPHTIFMPPQGVIAINSRECFFFFFFFFFFFKSFFLFKYSIFKRFLRKNEEQNCIIWSRTKARQRKWRHDAWTVAVCLVGIKGKNVFRANGSTFFSFPTSDQVPFHFFFHYYYFIFTLNGKVGVFVL